MFAGPPLNSRSSPNATATPPPTPSAPLLQAMHTLEDFMYQYNRNIQEYNQNIRHLSHQLDNITRELGAQHQPLHQHQYTFAFESLQPSLFARDAADESMSEEELLQQLRMSTYSETDPGIILTCPISLERFREGDEMCEIIGCGHRFKRQPVLQWLRRNPVCPVCRHNLRPQQQPAPDNTENAPPPSPINTSPTTSDNMFRHILDNLTTRRDLSGGQTQLLYEFEMPLEMLAQSLRFSGADAMASLVAAGGAGGGIFGRSRDDGGTDDPFPHTEDMDYSVD